MKKQLDIYRPKRHGFIDGKWYDLNLEDTATCSIHNMSATFPIKYFPERIIDLSSIRRAETESRNQT